MPQRDLHLTEDGHPSVLIRHVDEILAGVYAVTA
jgi:hypothetical protein